MNPRQSPTFVRRYAGGVIKSPSPSPAPFPFIVQQPRPQCTHMVMNRIRGNHTCDSCGRPSPMRWIYQCAQDLPQHIHSSHLCDVKEFSASEDSDRSELIALGISTSIIAQYEAGRYTTDQIQMIKDQKKHVHKVIEETLQSALISRSPSTGRLQCQQVSTSEMHSMAVPHREDLDATRPRMVRAPSLINAVKRRFPTVAEPCHFKCCHRCRPFLQDRLVSSIEAVLNNEEPPLSLAETKELNVLDASVLRNLDYYAAQQSIGVIDPTISQYDFASDHPLSGQTSLESLSIDDDQLWPIDSASQSASPCDSSPILSNSTSPTRSTFSSSSISLPTTPLSDRSFTHSNGEEFDVTALQMRKADTWHYSSLNRISAMELTPQSGTSTRSFSLPLRPAVSSGHDADQSSPDARAGAGRRSSYSSSGGLTTSSSSNYSDEVEVEGGVALTEEAVEMRLPDVLTPAQYHRQGNEMTDQTQT